MAYNFGLEAPICISKDSFEILRFSAFIWAQEKGHFMQKQVRKLCLKCINDSSFLLLSWHCHIFGYCHVSLHISDNLSPNLISSDITGKQRSRAFTLIKIPLPKGRVLTNASALPVQRQVLEQLFITDPKVAFGHASLLWIWHGDLSNIIQCHLISWLRTTSYIKHKTLSSSLVLILLALPTFCSHLYNPYLTLIHLWSPDLMKVVINLF